jgi:hypothetical protein
MAVLARRYSSSSGAIARVSKLGLIDYIDQALQNSQGHFPNLSAPYKPRARGLDLALKY